MHLQRRAEYLAAPDADGERARTLERQHAAYNVYSQLGLHGRRRLRKAKQGLPLDCEPPWLHLVSEEQRTEYKVVWADAITL
jgi:hypothetical protein